MLDAREHDKRDQLATIRTAEHGNFEIFHGATPDHSRDP
jgi:hypothetical protein